MSPRTVNATPRTGNASASVPIAAVIWGVAIGVGQAASPLAFWWLAPSTVYALSIAVIASVYIGFAVADGRTTVLVTEISVAAAFVVLAAIAVASSSWVLVAGLVLHGLKDMWQHHTHFVRNTRWWPPFCAVVDFVAATILAILIISGTSFHA